jgi:type I restriction enzyme S subunit
MSWEYIRLEEIAEFRNGVNFTCDSFGTGIKVINVADFKDKMYPDYENLGELDSEANWSNECFLRENDIVFVRSNGNKNLIGRSIFIKDLPENIKITFSAFCIRLRFKEIDAICPQFYLYIFKSPLFRGILSQYGNGTNISNLNQDILNNMSIPRPSLTIQSQIAIILSSYDELIENNKQRIKLLEEMAAEIYKEWFVRMRFPGYQTAKFFNELGEEVKGGTEGALPEGWEHSRLESACDIQMGQSPLSEFYNEDNEGLPFHQGVTNFNNRFPNHVIYCTDLKRVADEGDILLSVRAPVGRINIATSQLVIGRGLCSIKHKMNLPNYCYYLLKDVFIKEDSFGNGAVFNAVSKNDLLRIKIIQPTFDVCNKFQEIIKPLDDEIKVLTDKNQLLQQTRDLLLPRLISGKLSVEHLLYAENEGLMAAEPKSEYQVK